MSDTRRFVIEGAPLPVNFRGTPQQLFDAMLDRMVVQGDGDLLVNSDVAPSGNQGPWLKGGTKWYVWDDTSSSYIPLDVSDSVHAQIYVGDQATAPDPTQYQFWLKTDGPTLLGVFYYVGATSGWQSLVTKELVDKSIQESFLQDSSVARRAIQDKAVGTAELDDNIPVTKLDHGDKWQVPASDGSVTSWKNLIVHSTEWPFTGSAQVIEAPNDLAVTPNWVRAVFRCKTAENGAAVGDEYDALGSVTILSGKQVSLMANATKIRLILQGQVSLLNIGSPNTAFHPTPANWRIVFYYGVG